MKQDNKYIYELKEILLNSPIRQKLSQEVSIPFKDVASSKLEENIENIKALENNEDSPLNIVVVGEVKSGKSSLINALVGFEVSEVDVLEATSNIIQIGYSEEYHVKENQDVTKISLDLEYLKKINIVDTPGIKSITIKNEQTTLNYLKNADLILFVIDATHIGQKDIFDVLDIICEYEKEIIGVINKADLLDLLEDNKDEVLDYIKEEYEIYMDQFFMVSSYLEYQEKLSKKAKAKDTDLVISNYTDLKDNFNDLNQYIQNLSKRSEEIKKDSVKTSIKVIAHKDVLNHYDYLKSLSMLIDEYSTYEKLLQNKSDYIDAKMNFEIDDWLNRVFFSDEKKRLKSDIENTNNYISENYINEIINRKKVELDKLYFEEWSMCLKEISDKMDDDIKRYINEINYNNEFIENPNLKIDAKKAPLNEMLAVVGTGALLGATSGGVMSVYSALLGSSAASMTITSALITYCPPLLIAGTISGAVGKVIYDKVQLDKKNSDVLKDIDLFIEDIRYKISQELKVCYKNSSKDIMYTTLDILKDIKNISINKYDLETFKDEIQNYIEVMNVYNK